MADKYVRVDTCGGDKSMLMIHLFHMGASEQVPQQCRHSMDAGAVVGAHPSLHILCCQLN